MIDCRSDIPDKPGVYLFKVDQRVLYIGKAKNLKKRVSQYFKPVDHTIVRHLVQEADDIEYIVTDNEKDALLLEYNLVHQYKPPFNIRLKDDKSFPVIEITTSEPYAGVYFSRQAGDKNFYVGPITDSRKTRDLIDIITRLFKLRTCTTNTFKRGAGCLYYYIDRCSAPCIGKINREEYEQSVADAVRFLKGRKTIIMAQLKEKMMALAEKQAFEEAQKIKEDIQLLQTFNLKSYITSVSAGKRDYDVIVLHYDSVDNENFVILFSVLDNRIKKKDFFNFHSISTGKAEILKDFLIGYYETNNIPHEILVPLLPSDRDDLEALFTRMAGRRAVIKRPVKGKKRKTMVLALNNLNLYINKNKYALIARQLQEALGLTRFPAWIEGYDISHFSERDRVGAAVVFINGEAARKRYRNYIIKEALPGDTEALKEVLERRLLKMENYPDLLLIDGGKPQLGAALEIKKKLKISSDVVALAKKEERIFLENGGSVLFPEDSPQRFLVQNIRDEVHRRAITHHRKRRQKNKFNK